MQELPRKALVMEVKRNGGAFQPFQREKSVGKTNRPVAKVPASAPATSSTTDTVSGGSGESLKKEEKDGQGQRKQRRNWSPELHRRFLHALQQLGGSHGMLLSNLFNVFEINLLGWSVIMGYVIYYDWMHMGLNSFGCLLDLWV